MRTIPSFLSAAVLLLLASSCDRVADEKRLEVEPTFNGLFIRKNSELPLQDEQSWPSALLTDCRPSGPDDRPTVCIRRTTDDLVDRGAPLTADIHWSGAPPNGYLIVYLEHDAASTERYLGATGPLMRRPIPAAGSGATTFRWNGREFPCAPTDVPILCPKQAEIGRYRLRVALYDRRPSELLAQPVVIAHALSSPFVVTGEPDLAPLARSMWWAAMNGGIRLGVDSSLALAGDINGSAVRVRERDGQLCGRIPANPPYVSTLEACVMKEALIGEAGLLRVPPEAIQVTGRLTVTKGSIDRPEAIRLAQSVADPPYRSRVRFHRQPTGDVGYDHREGDFMEWSRRNPWATTYLADSVGETVYRPDLGGSWMVVVHETMAGGSLPDAERFSDKVLVLVQADRRACVLETRPRRGADFILDPRTARPRC